jgi:hypothetical protein
MKKCPTCGKEFEDSMKFCQLDGTSLETVAEEAPFDPYATMVSIPSKPAETTLPEMDVLPPLEADPVEPASTSSTTQDDVLDLSEPDPLKTMMVSSDELQQAMAADEPRSEEPPAMPTPDAYITPEVEDPSEPSFGDAAPPPSPFSEPEQQKSSEPVWDEAATIMQPPVNVPFDPPAPVQEWTPPPVPDASWQDQQIGSTTPFQPPPAGVGGQNKTLPIVSLVLGIASICCYVSPLTGIAAIITGMLGLKNIKNDPNTYGGKGLALAGIICGAVFLLIGIVYYILLIFGLASGAFR